MKKFKAILYIGLLTAMSITPCFAIQNVSECVNTASTTATNDTFVRIPGTRPGSELFGVVVGSPAVAGVIGIYDSSATATQFISSITLNGTAAANPQFLIRVSSGITYTTSGQATGSNVTILYRNPNLP